MIGYSDDAKVTDLLAPLRRLEPVPFSPPVTENRRVRRPVLVTAIVVIALALTGVAIADGVGAFNGIQAAQRPQTGADKLDLKDPACAGDSQVAATSPFCHLVLSSARMIRTLSSGRKLWVVTDTRGDLCVILQGAGSPRTWSAAGCGSTLSASQPTTLASFGEGPGIKSITFGVALDSVVAVSFMAGDQTVTIPVTDNVWAYEGHNSARNSLTVHYADGTTSVLDY